MTATGTALETPPRQEACSRVDKNVMMIMIALEDESGETRPVDIDIADEDDDDDDDDDDDGSKANNGVEEKEETNTGVKRKVSITQRVLRSRNSEQELASLQEAAENRKQELADLLSEHAQLVHTVETMRGDSTDKENQRTTPAHNNETIVTVFETAPNNETTSTTTTTSAAATSTETAYAPLPPAPLTLSSIQLNNNCNNNISSNDGGGSSSHQ